MARYAVSDIHGMYSLWIQIKNCLTDQDTLFVLGDSIDKGESGWKIIKEILLDDRVIPFWGNHEKIMYQAGMSDSRAMPFYWTHLNNGFPTWSDMREDSNSFEILDLLDKKSIYQLDLINKNNDLLFLSHAGTTVKKALQEGYNKEDLLFDRTHIDIDNKEKQNIFERINSKNFYIIHGHTPVIAMGNLKKEELIDPEIQFYHQNKINLDLASFYTGKIALFNLDTFEVKYFYDNEVYQKYLKGRNEENNYE